MSTDDRPAFPAARPAALASATPSAAGAACATDDRPLIVHVIHHLVTGGMENGLVGLINHMPPTAFRHAVVCIEDYSDFRSRIERPEVAVIALHRSRIGTWRLRWRLYRLFRRWRPAIVHSRNQSGLDALLPARLAGVRHRVHSEHGWDVHDLDGRNRKQQWLRRLHAPLVGHYLTVSRSLRDYLVDRVGIGAGRITTICNGVDTDRFRPSAAPAVLPAGFADGQPLVVGTVGRLQAVKDQQTLLRAFAELVAPANGAAGACDARLVIVGHGPLAESLHALARTLGIERWIWFAGDRRDVDRVLQALDVFVLPSLAEGISNTVLEAMATGLPILATRVGGNPELVADGVNGHLFEAGDVAGLVRLLRAHATDPGLRRAEGSAARRRAVDEFSLATMVGRYQATYEAMAGRDVAAPRPAAPATPSVPG